MVKNLGKRLLPLMLAIMLIMSAMPLNVFASTISVLDGQITITDDKNTVKNSGGTVTATATGGLFSGTTNTIQIYNESESIAKLSFDYSADDAKTVTIAGDPVSASGSYSILLEAKTCVEIKITSNGGFGTAKLTLSNFSLTAAAAASDVTFNYDSAYGSITVNGTATADKSVVEIPSSGAALVATPASGATFLGWVNAADSSLLSTSASYTVTPAADMTVKAVFTGANSAPHFIVGTKTSKSESIGLFGAGGEINYNIVNGTHLFDNFNDAVTGAQNSAGKAMVLVNNATLPAGEYTIPAGVTMLLPYDTAYTMYTTTAHSIEGANYTKPTEYRTLTLADGANLIVDGAISLSCKHASAQGNRQNGGSPTEKVPFIRMQGNSNITINNGGALYAYGFITGSGSVTAKNGATIYENFQIMDFRGGSQTTSMENGVFPLSQYYVQNIEVPMTLEYGAKEYSYTTIRMSGGDYASAINFIGPSDSMFNLTSGYVKKTYDGTTDRLLIDLKGDMTVSPVVIKIQQSLDSKKYELPINSNISVTAMSGSKIDMNQDIAMFPGSEIIIEQGANCTIGQGVSIYIYDADQWGNYTGAGTDTPFKPVTYAPGRTYNRTNADLVDAKIQVDGYIDASLGYVYTTEGGANVCSSGTGIAKVTPGTETIAYQFMYANNKTYAEIPITPVKFKNADGSYLASATGTYLYNQEHEKWAADAHTFTQWTKAPTCEENGYTRHTCACGYYYDDSIVQATGHEWIENVEDCIEANCVKEGKRCFECKICGDTKEETIPKDFNKHNIYEEITEPTCTQDGYYKSSCLDCNSVLEEKTLPKEGHEPKSSVVTEPTCTEKGYTTHVCGKCEEEYVDTYVDASGHKYNEVVTEPTCTKGGYTTYTCSLCDDSFVGNEVDATGHSHNAVVTAPTCTDKGYTTYTCHCGDSYVGDYVDALGHSHNAVVTAPTCTEKGYTTYTCTVCGDSYVDSYVDALGHNMSDWIIDTEASCETKGARHKNCSACDYTENEVIPAIGHSYSEVVTAPTCTEQGYTTYTCHCGDSYVADEVDALGHSYGDWEVVTAPTHTKEGLKKHTCHCGHEKTEAIPVIICDIDEEGVGATELTKMRKFILGTEVPTAEEKVLFDMNDDGVITIKDLVRLKKYIADIPS